MNNGKQSEAPGEGLLDYLLCAEHYRNAESQYDEDDYFVDGLVLMHLPLPPKLDRHELETVMKKVVQQLQTPENREDLQKTFPKFSALMKESPLWWVHLMRKEHKDSLPKDFHTSAFTEEELLGIAPEEDPEELPKEMWFDRDGDPMEGPPDRAMAFLYG